MPKPLSRQDQTLLKLLKAPPKPFTSKAKPKASPSHPNSGFSGRARADGRALPPRSARN